MSGHLRIRDHFRNTRVTERQITDYLNLDRRQKQAFQLADRIYLNRDHQYDLLCLNKEHHLGRPTEGLDLVFYDTHSDLGSPMGSVARGLISLSPDKFRSELEYCLPDESHLPEPKNYPEGSFLPVLIAGGNIRSLLQITQVELKYEGFGQVFVEISDYNGRMLVGSGSKNINTPYYAKNPFKGTTIPNFISGRHMNGSDIRTTILELSGKKPSIGTWASNDLDYFEPHLSQPLNDTKFKGILEHALEVGAATRETGPDLFTMTLSPAWEYTNFKSDHYFELIRTICNGFGILQK